MLRRCAALALMVFGCFGFAAVGSAADGDQTTVEVTAYIWGAGVYGDINTPRAKYSNNTEFSDIWDNLSVAVMGRGRVQHGDFALVGDVLYMKLETDRKTRFLRLGPEGNITIRSDAKFELTSWIAELSGAYRVFKLDDVTLKPTAELYAGSRYWYISPEVNGKVAGTSFKVDTSEDWFDPIVGARIGLALSPTVQLGIQGDVGGFGISNSSEFAWMQTTTLSWQFAEHWRLHMGYKFLQFRRDTGDVNMRQQFRGPLLATSVLF